VIAVDEQGIGLKGEIKGGGIKWKLINMRREEPVKARGRG